MVNVTTFKTTLVELQLIRMNKGEYCIKKREIKEKLEEKEILLKLDELKREKSGHLTGMKRKNSPTLCIIEQKK